MGTTEEFSPEVELCICNTKVKMSIELHVQQLYNMIYSECMHVSRISLGKGGGAIEIVTPPDPLLDLYIHLSSAFFADTCTNDIKGYTMPVLLI